MVNNESDLIHCIRTGLMASLPNRVRFTKHMIPGQPDFLIEIFKEEKKINLLYDMHCEFKWRKTRPGSLLSEWQLLSGLQSISLMRMAAAGKNVFLVVGHADVIEAPWYYLHPAQAKKVMAREASPESILSLMMLSKPWKRGMWSTGSDHGDPDEGPSVSWGERARMRKRMKNMGLILPK